HATAEADGQSITLVKKNAPLKEIFKAIQKQSEYSFVYGDDVLNDTRRVSISVKDAPIDRVLEICFKNQPLRYEFDGMAIIVKKAVHQSESVATLSTDLISVLSVKGKVVDEENRGIAKATI